MASRPLPRTMARVERLPLARTQTILKRVLHMRGVQFEQFSAEVLTRGARAVLPQNLPEQWLNALLQEAEIFQQDNSSHVEDCCAGLLSAVLVLHAQHN